MTEAQQPEDATLDAGPAYLVGYVFPSRWRAASPLPGEELWMTDGGIVVGTTGWQTSRISGPDTHVRTDDHVTREDAVETAVGEPTFIPWEAIRSGRVVEHRYTPHELRIDLMDGTTRTIWRGTPLDTASETEAAWQELKYRLAREVSDVSLDRDAASPHWKLLVHPWLVFPLLAVGCVLVGLMLYTANRVMDAPLERWEAGHYTSDDPVAFIYADSAAALPIPYQLADRSRFWIVDDDAVVIRFPRGARFGGDDRCIALIRDGEWLAYENRERPPCTDPRTGAPLDRSDRVRVSDVLGGSPG